MELHKKKILIFIDWYVPGFKAGGPIRSVKNLVDQLKEKAEFFIFTRDRDYGSVEAYPNIKPDTWVSIEKNVQVFYCSPENLKKSTLKQILSGRPYNKIYINGIYSWYYSILPVFLMGKDQKRKTIIAARGMLARSAIGVKQNKKKIFLFLARTTNLYTGVTFHATGIQEKEDILEQLGIGISIKEAANLPAAVQGIPTKIGKVKINGELSLVNIARIAPEKNTLFALQVLAECPADFSLSLDLYGPVYDKIYWRDCEQLIEGLPANIKVRYQGNLPNDQVNESLQKYHFFYLPSRGENFGHSILEAFSAGLPVVISDQTPWKDLYNKKVGYDLPLEKVKFLEAIVEACQMDQAKYDEWSYHAKSLAKRTSEDPTTLEAYRQIFDI